MEIVALGEVSTYEVARRTGIPYTVVWVALQYTLLCYPYNIQLHHELLPVDFVKWRAIAVWVFYNMVEDD